MPLDPISYSAVKKLEKEIDKKVEEKLSEGVDTLSVNTIKPKDTNTVTVQGNLNVVGNVTYIETTNLQVKDNVIEINSGETGSGVTLGSAGITIDRGTEPDAQVIWDENNDKFVFKLEDGTKLPIDVSVVNADTVNATTGNVTNVSSSSITTDSLTVNNSATINGASIMLGSDLDANSHKIINLADPTNSSDAVTKSYVDTNFYTKSEVDSLIASKDEFIELNDTPSSYTGYGNYFIRVKSTEDGLEFVEAYDKSTIDSWNLIKNYTLQADLTPDTDNTRSIGSSTKRLANLYVVNLYTGDIKLMNDWTVTERDENGNIIKNGVRILNDEGEEIFKITEDGIYFKGKKLKLAFEE